MEEQPEDQPNIQADNKSIAIGKIAAGGSIGDINIHAGDTKIYQYASEDEVPPTSAELENGLNCFAEFLPERAPILQKRFSSIDRKLRATLGAEWNSLSPVLKKQRGDAIDEMKLMCMEVLDISFRAVCTGQSPPPYDSRPPFLGLIAFRPEDREFYFGREALITKLVTRIQNYPFLAVMGASGSGKSSLVMAGLIPTLGARMAYLTPSSTSLVQLQTVKDKAQPDAVFVVDQFEELFTLTHDAQVRQQFIEALLECTKTNRVIVTMRADFWGEVATYKDLRQVMQEHQELIAPMDTSELRSAVEQQAAAVGLRFDQTLIESILDEVEGEPGAMPLLQHALWMLWKRRHGLWLKADEYRAFGGVKQAIASTAEEVYASCPGYEQDLLRNTFLRLTRLDDSGERRDTRRRVLIEELIPVHDDSNAAINLLNKLADARLIVKTDKEAEVAHEALIRHWSRLTNWLHEDRENLRLHESLSEDAREWERANRDESLLNHRGGRLELAVTMSQNPRYRLNPIEMAYLNACIEVQERARIEKEEQQRRQLEAAKKLAETAQAQVLAEQKARKASNRMAVVGMILMSLIVVLLYTPVQRLLLHQRAMGPALVVISASDVTLGDSRYTSDDPMFLPRDRHFVEVFKIEPYEVTNERYLLCVKAGNCTLPAALPSTYSGAENKDFPVVNISAIQASEFCEWLGRELPSESEWERAARYTDERAWPWQINSPPTENLANFYFEKEPILKPVGQYPDGKSTEGVYDLAGNVLEWTRSAYELGQPDLDLNSATQPEVLSVRGGSYDTNYESMQNTIAFRFPASPFVTNNAIGFRCVSK